MYSNDDNNNNNDNNRPRAARSGVRAAPGAGPLLLTTTYCY